MNTHSDKSRKNLENSIKGIYTDSPYFARGNKFEREVSGGSHKEFSDLLDPCEKQVWCQTYLDTVKLSFRIAGKLDAYDRKNQIIYDTKRVDSYYIGKYSEDNTIQHLLYFYMNEDAREFVYLIAYGKGDKVDGYERLVIKRPSDDDLKHKVLGTIVDFINYLKYKGLWADYLKAQKYTKKKY